MNNYRQSGPRDEQSLPDGDQGFVGVDERVPPPSLPAGFCSGARNKRFRNGRAATREGITLLPWMKGDGKTPFTEVYGGAVFNDPNQSGQWILIAADGGVWKTRPNFVAVPVPLPFGVTLTASTFKKFVQANSAIILLRGLANECLQCTNLDEGFKPILQENTFQVVFDAATNWVNLPQHNLLAGDPVSFAAESATLPLPAAIVAGKTYYTLETPNADSFTISATPGGTPVTWNTSDTDVTTYEAEGTILDGAEPIPPATDGIFILNRLLLINGKDTCVVSDIGDFTRYQPVASEFRINEGDSYTLLCGALYNADTVVFFKDGSVLKVLGVSGDLSQAAGPFNVTEQYGAAGAQALAGNANEIYWLTSELRIASLTLTALNQEQGTDNALSDPLVQTFGRINATYAAGARLAVFNGFLHCALPLDAARIVSAVNLIGAGTVYDGTGAYVLGGLTIGQTYTYSQGANGGYLVNGTETLRGDSEFTAQGVTVTLHEDASLAPGLPVTETVAAVLASGVNTGVAVYDFLNQAWAGTDECPSGPNVTCVKDWLKITIGGTKRLAFIGADGWLHLYYDGYEDEAMVAITPYVDVLCDKLEALNDGDTLSVNSSVGPAIADTTASVNHDGVPPKWGASSPGAARQNLWADSNGVGGYGAPNSSPWGHANCNVSQVDYGVRFTATNGVCPVIEINGTGVVDGSFAWAFVDSHPGPSEIQSIAISDWVRTRAYLCQRLWTKNLNADMKRYMSAAAQIATWSPSYTITAVTPGIQTESVYAPGETRDRLKYFAPHDAADWDPTNTNDDYNAPRRQDYSWLMTDLGMLLGTEAGCDQEQEYVHRVPVNEHGVWMQLDIANTDGRLELLAVAMESEGEEMLSGPVTN